jgi:lipopolysaccharide/colanic/teichoic acid biosynthesis glycosyltransferase
MDKILYPVVKRLMDLVGACLGLLFTSLLFIPIALVIILDSPGAVLFVQERVGKDLKQFKCYKFRTMILNASKNGLKPIPNDERVTRVGRFLRRTSLDELPQFFNILRGEMSLVGPRPEQIPFLDHYSAWQRERFTVKPGLTGWWQVNGRKQPMHEHIDEDIYYVEHGSFWLDVTILWQTFGAVLGGKGAV